LITSRQQNFSTKRLKTYQTIEHCSCYGAPIISYEPPVNTSYQNELTRIFTIPIALQGIHSMDYHFRHFLYKILIKPSNSEINEHRYLSLNTKMQWTRQKRNISDRTDPMQMSRTPLEKVWRLLLAPDLHRWLSKWLNWVTMQSNRVGTEFQDQRFGTYTIKLAHRNKAQKISHLIMLTPQCTKLTRTKMQIDWALLPPKKLNLLNWINEIE